MALLLFIFSGSGGGQELQLLETPPSLIFATPYFVVLILALLGINVFIVLTVGLLAGGAVGLLFSSSYTLLDFAKNTFEGYTSMNEILILSLLIGGLSELAKDRSSQ